KTRKEKDRIKRPPLSPHAPRRAGDPPPVPGSSRHTRKKEKRKKGGKETPFASAKGFLPPKTTAGYEKQA
ncbi:hypothetical protein, partial [uncultured Desulfovibrio sp.]|uniref:hypothetical protein n=1 Tax=uncultured Desulfovibrio sp. TaxID=167968 RepID=UPI00262E30B7